MSASHEIYSELASSLASKGRKGRNKDVFVDFLASDDVARIIRFDGREDRDKKYDCFMKLVRRSGALDVIDVIRRNDYILLVKTLAD